MRWHQVLALLRAQAERITPSALARELGVPRSTLGRWVNGKQEPQGEARAMLFAWAEAQQGDTPREEPRPRERAVLEGQSIELEALMAYVLERQRRLTAHLRAQDQPLALSAAR